MTEPTIIERNGVRCELHHCDCMNYMRGLPEKAFDLAIVDPPWGIDAGGKAGSYFDSTTGLRATSGVRNMEKEWDKKKPDPEYWKELFRITRNQIVWGGNYFTDFLPVSRGWIGWDKKQPQASTFAMLELAWSSFDVVIDMFRMYSTHVTQGVRIHPTQKPVALYSWLLANYAEPGQTILDTHLGSGSIAIACLNHGYSLTACELDGDYFAAAVARIQREAAQGVML